MEVFKVVARSALPCHVVGFHSGLQILSWNEVGSRKFLPSPYALIGPMLGHFGNGFAPLDQRRRVLQHVALAL